jgi:hypothetical protein
VARQPAKTTHTHGVVGVSGGVRGCLGIPVLEHIEVTPDDIRKLADLHYRDDVEVALLTGKVHTAQVLRACADFVEATLNDVDTPDSNRVLLAAMARLEALK